MITEKQIQSIKLSDDHNEVEVSFVNTITPESDSEEIGEESKKQIEQYFYSKIRPHKDFIDAFKKLRKAALEICDIEVSNKSLSDWNVSGVKIAGDMFLHQSRVILTLSKIVNMTNKVIKFKTPQVTMFPEMEDTERFSGAEALTKQIESLIDETWAYLNGKFEDEEMQLELFHSEPKHETHFTQ